MYTQFKPGDRVMREPLWATLKKWCGRKGVIISAESRDEFNSPKCLVLFDEPDVVGNRLIDVYATELHLIK